MKKTLLAGVSALLAMFALGPATATAAPPPEVLVCVGGAQSDGSFETQEITTGQLPGVGLALTNNLCVVLNPQALSDALGGVAEDIGNAELPSEPPTQEQLEAILEDVQNLDPENPLAALFFLSSTCANLNSSDLCNTLISNALSAPVPLGDVTLDGESGSCFGGQQSGTGTVSGGGSDSLSLDWTANYADGGGLLGVISGTAEPRFGGSGESWDVSGVIGPSCGAGAKVLVMAIS